MLSTFPACSDGFFGSQFPGLIEGGFSPWDCQELLPILLQQQQQQQNHEPVFSTVIEPVHSGSGSDDSNHIQTNTNVTQMNRKRSNNSSGSGSEDERKRRRMISNRESARRSRMRKQKHLQNLRNQVNRLKIGNRDMMNRLHMVIHHSQLVRKENERLQIESVMLQQKLWDMHQLLLLRQLQQSSTAWPCNNIVNIHQ